MSIEKPWGGRFTDSTDEAVEVFTCSVEADAHIAEDDVEGSIAHARMLAEVGLISAADRDALVEGLVAIGEQVRSGTFEWDDKLEDVHMNVERRLAAIVGDDVAGRLHTARSRNDQVALDARLYLRRRLGAIRRRLVG